MWDLGGRFLNNALTMRICDAQHQKSRSCVSKSADPKGTADPFHIIPQIPSRYQALVNVPWFGDFEHHQNSRICWRLYPYIYIYPQYLGDVKHQNIYQPHPAKLSAQETLWQRQDWDLGHLYLAPPGVEMWGWWSTGLLMGKSLWGFMGFPTLADHTIYPLVF